MAFKGQKRLKKSSWEFFQWARLHAVKTKTSRRHYIHARRGLHRSYVFAVVMTCQLKIHGNYHILNSTSKIIWLHCAAGLGWAKYKRRLGPACLLKIHGNKHISNPTSKIIWLFCAAGLGRATRGVWGRLISIIGSALRNSNLDLVTSAELNQAARLDGDATHCGTTCEKLDRITFFDRKESVFFGTQA